MSQGCSIDVAQEAFTLGAMGYVVKAHAGSELLDAVEAVCQGRQFLSKGLSGRDRIDVSGGQAPGHLVHQEVLPSLVPNQAEITHSHEVQFYSDDAAFLLGLACFIETALNGRQSGYRSCDRVTSERSSSDVAGTWHGLHSCHGTRLLSPFGCRRGALDIHGE